MAKKFTIFIIFFLISCNTRNSDLQAPQKQYNIPTAELFDFISRSYKQGLMEWKLEAIKADLYSDLEKVNLFDFTLKKYDEEGALDYTISSDFGTYWQVKKDISLQGNVILNNSDGSTVKTDSLVYTEKDKKLTTEDWVTIIQKNGDTLHGKGLIADRELNNIRLKSNVSGVSQ